MSARHAVALLALLLASAGGCNSASPTPVGNKNTNWLVSCSTSAECGDAAACTCGVCTIACEASDDCAASSGTCTLNLATTLQCGGTSESAVCLEPCATASDCSDDRVCVQGSCVTRVKDLCAGRAGAVLCAGLDDALPAGWADASSPGSEVTASPMLRFSGVASLLAHTSGANGRSRLVHPLATMTSGSLYLRAWAYMSPGAVTDNVESIVIGDPDTEEYGVRVVYSAGQLGLSNARVMISGSVTPPFGRWYCLRLELGIGNSGSVKAYLDDQLFVDQTGVDTLPVDGVRNISIGIDFAGQDQPAELYLDDLLLDTQPVECGR